MRGGFGIKARVPRRGASGKGSAPGCCGLCVVGPPLSGAPAQTCYSETLGYRGPWVASERPQRKLAAILVADVVGYCRLVGADEDRVLARLRPSAAT